jgi:hypothetical protein
MKTHNMDIVWVGVAFVFGLMGSRIHIPPFVGYLNGIWDSSDTKRVLFLNRFPTLALFFVVHCRTTHQT